MILNLNINGVEWEVEMVERLGGYRGVVHFTNGYSGSICFGETFYSNGVDTYELAVMKHGELCYDTVVTNDVVGHATKSDLEEALSVLENLPTDLSYDLSIIPDAIKTIKACQSSDNNYEYRRALDNAIDALEHLRKFH